MVRGHAFLALRAYTCDDEGAATSDPPQTKQYVFTSLLFSCVVGTDYWNRILLEVPHPYFDHTRAQGVLLFPQSQSLALLMSGTHRCASASLSGCTGNVGRPIKTNCKGRHKYSNSDVAHSTKHMFHTMHVHLADNIYPDSVVVSLHSTKQESFVVSDGTSGQARGDDPVGIVGLGLQEEFPRRKIEACNRYLHAPGGQMSIDEQVICGATNLQGRHMNGALEPCTAEIGVTGEPLMASGRFIHIEQPKALIGKTFVQSTVEKINTILERIPTVSNSRESRLPAKSYF